MINKKLQPLLIYISKYIDLTNEEITFLESKLTIRNYLKGQYILQQGDVCQYGCFILSGCTRTFYVDKDGQEHILMFGIEDWWASDMGSFITQTPADFNVQCLENTEVVMFSHKVNEELYKEIPKLERFFRQITERAFVASQKRIVRGFSLAAKEQYLLFREQYPEIEQRIPQYMVASYLGITKEFLSKIKSQLVLE
ncbi:Crp/Fnr family transcriptional regulator [Thalassobellus suaedae]|uniref:Crp/Fnr family transcriptional regulator n=1 Tax=Thalassobellus suaedae TaxID=3074124 RepID=A0ABY9Y1C8_9FLAO|nr:Crp/Fnr family transcriptional regulator [Flavobacteriaceae bacterium HL-DH10]